MGSYGKSKRGYALMGLDRVAANLGAGLINLEDFGLCECRNPEGRIIKDFKATALLEQVEAIVNIPKLKTHILTGITGAIKNVLGLLPGSLKRAVHVAAPTGGAMALALVDIYGGIKRKAPIVLHVLDGITGMEGMGPSKGKARQAGWLSASTDPVALDAVGAAIMGFQPDHIKIITRSAEAGFGVFDKAHINLIGGAWEELSVPGFRHPFTRTREWTERFIPKALLVLAFDRLNEAKPNIRTEGCLRCGQCLEACPAQALQLTDEGLRLNRDLCIECYCCLEHCPHDGLWVHRGLWEKFKRRHETRGHLT
jgi:ferredoxin